MRVVLQHMASGPVWAHPYPPDQLRRLRYGRFRYIAHGAILLQGMQITRCSQGFS